MKTLILMSFLLISQAWAQGITLPEGVSSEGKLRLDCSGSYMTHSKEGKSRIEVSNFGEGKIRVGIFGEKTEHGGYSNSYYNYTTFSYSFHLIGVDNGYGAFDLYPADKKSFDTSIGELVLFQKSISINLFADLAVTKGSKEDYGYSCKLSKTGDIKFTVVTPQCFNRRGKIKKCPIIKF